MVGIRLKELRSIHGMSLRALASETGLSPTMLSQIERGVTEPSLLASCLAFLEHHEPDLVAVAGDVGVTPEALVAARRVLEA